MRPRILLVDDDRAFRLSTSALLESEFDVTGASDGTQAVEQLQGDFDLMILDVRMPGIQGVDLVLDAGILAGGPGSTVVDISGDIPVVLREGAVSGDKIMASHHQYVRKHIDIRR